MTCPYFGTCGGCTAQHISYETQVTNKRKVVFDAVSRAFPVLNLDAVSIHTGEPFGYRNRMDFVFTKKGLGMRKKGAYQDLVPITQCPIANARVNDLLREVNDWATNIDVYDMVKRKGTFRYAVVRAPGNETSITFVLNEDSTKIDEAQEKIDEFVKTTSADHVNIAYVPSKTDVSISEDVYAVKGDIFLPATILGHEIRFSTQGFFQNNTAVAEQMASHVRSLLEKHQTREYSLLDLYGGVGLFSVCVGDLFSTVRCVEAYAPSIDAAKENLKNNGIVGEAIVCDSKSIRKLELPKISNNWMVITDPPRSGMDLKAIYALLALKPDVVIYVSCNPQQLSKELALFRDYEVKSVAMFDLFPQTPHCEAVVELQKK